MISNTTETSMFHRARRPSSLGDPGLFTKAMFVVGEECKSLLDTGYPTNPESRFATDAIPAERIRFLSRSDFDTSIGPFPRALDYFGDGSMYIIDTPGAWEAWGYELERDVGHLPGHVNVLARTSPDDAWIHLGGDVNHFCLSTGEGQVAYSVSAGAVRCMHVNREMVDLNRSGDPFFPGTIPPLA